MKRFQPMLLSALPLCAVALLCVQGCGDEATGPSGTASTFSSIKENILEKNCTTSSCHGKLGQRGGLILEGEDVYNHLVGVPAVNEAANARGLKLVVPGKPDSSFLLVKLTGPGAGEGDLMPYGNQALGSSEIDAIRTWIANGAKND